MSPFILSIFLMTLGLGTTITFISSHWLLAWMGLELNTLAIIPLMAQRHHPRSTEATTKYFLIQATAAATMLFAGTTNAWLTGQWDITTTTHPFPLTLLTLALSLKLGLAPLHTWLPEVLQGLDLITGLILATWQKLAPFAILLQLQPAPSQLMIALGITSTLVGGWGGLNQTQLRKILAYSSISHLGWMILVAQFSPALTLLTLIIYVAMTSTVFLTFHLTSAKSISTLIISSTKTPAIACLVPLTLLSLGGLPPMTGFAPKLLILQELTKQTLPLTATITALSALLSLYFYLRLTYASSLTLSPNITSTPTMWRLPLFSSTMPLAFFSTLSILLFPLLPALATPNYF
uniref:NADH-ubiquinone oxidoreductase chain 2 n=1 Tax=Aspasma minima TaxID=181476 RepID=Q8HKR0_ASPMI|nr:NADH dehydrogenase subunit 2 [Aspasma minima]BAC23788.1 NADH dehydrogenase subunit 2 [Aspasma minima]